MNTVLNTKRSRAPQGQTSTLYRQAALTAPIFVIVSSFLFAIDFVPTAIRTQATSSVLVAQENTPHAANRVADETAVPESSVPVRISVPSVEIDVTVITPESRSIDVLDRALLSGAVHYPGSGSAGTVGNMLIFGHSSYLPVVHNKAFKAFNELGDVREGAEIIVESETHRYTYQVQSVELRRAEEVNVPLNVTVPTITLATCNTFGAKEERYVVQGTLVAKKAHIKT